MEKRKVALNDNNSRSGGIGTERGERGTLTSNRFKHHPAHSLSDPFDESSRTGFPCAVDRLRHESCYAVVETFCEFLFYSMRSLAGSFLSVAKILDSMEGILSLGRER